MNDVVDPPSKAVVDGRVQGTLARLGYAAGEQNVREMFGQRGRDQYVSFLFRLKQGLDVFATKRTPPPRYGRRLCIDVIEGPSTDG